jgi:hypothetical protein
MKPSKTARTKRRRLQFSKKNYRNKKQGGMHKHETTRHKKKAQNREHAAAHASLSQLPGISPRDRSDTLMHSALAGMVTARFLYPQMSSPSPMPLHARALLGRQPAPAVFEAADMFRRAEKLSLDLRTLPEQQVWTQENHWSSKNFTPEAMGMCMEAARLYRGAVKLKYLPAYAPLAWMMSYTDPQQSLSLCDECIGACHASRTGVHSAVARQAQTDCTAIRAFVQYQEEVKALYDDLETMAPTPQGKGWGWPEPEPVANAVASSRSRASPSRRGNCPARLVVANTS